VHIGVDVIDRRDYTERLPQSVPMARSEEALKRRAEKRQRTDTEQRLADRIDMRKQQEKAQGGATKIHQSSSNSPNRKQPQSPVCDSHNGSVTNNTGDGRKNGGNPKCRSQEFSHDRHALPRPYVAKGEDDGDNRHSQSQSGVTNATKNTDEDTMKDLRQSDAPPSHGHNAKCTDDSRKRKSEMEDQPCEGVRDAPPQQRHRQPLSRHDEARSKKLVWAPQGDPIRISRNRELRLRFQETKGMGMDETDVQRAKVLIARDERKKVRNVTKIKPIAGTEVPKPGDAPTRRDETATRPDSQEVPSKQEEGKSKKAAAEARAKRDRNNALRKLYYDTGGIGMKEEHAERAKTLIDRAERKRQRRGNSRVDKSDTGKIEALPE
jgi:hypothetical protein